MMKLKFAQVIEAQPNKINHHKFGSETCHATIYIYIFNVLFFADCYKRISVGQRLVKPSVTQSYNHVEDDLACKNKCDESLSHCIAYSFG